MKFLQWLINEPVRYKSTCSCGTDHLIEVYKNNVVDSYMNTKTNYYESNILSEYPLPSEEDIAFAMEKEHQIRAERWSK